MSGTIKKLAPADPIERRGWMRNILYRGLPIELDANVARALADEILDALEQSCQAMPDADRIHELIEEGDGHWITCSGCHESEDGHDVGHYPHSDAFRCKLGGGCSECGGIGAVWDTTDWEAMGRDLAAGGAEMIISGEPWISATCQGEICRCGKPAVRKVGEEIAFDDPNPARHNLTAYVCAVHFAELLGPAAAYQVGLKTLASAGRCFCGFWPCATHQIDDLSTRGGE